MYDKLNFTVGILLVLCLTSFSPKKPKVLIIGDSISIGYTPFVQNYFAGKAIVKHNPGNAQHSGTGLEKIEEWIVQDDWDIIQFNWGLWDLCYRHPDSKVQGNRDKVNGSITYSLKEYRDNLNAIVTKLKETTRAKLIFVTTTYVPQNEAGRFKKDPKRYNRAARKIMKKHSVRVNNIYYSSVEIHKKFGKGSDDVHYSSEGSAALAELIIEFLLKELDTI